MAESFSVVPLWGAYLARTGIRRPDSGSLKGVDRGQSIEFLRGNRKSFIRRIDPKCAFGAQQTPDSHEIRP
jgi:hypothetical protein